MELNETSIQQLVDNPRESLAVEIKEWIDPASVQGMAKIVKTCLALRNHGGGYLIIGFEDETLKPSDVGIPNNVRATFHSDKIHALISRYALESFEVGVEFIARDDVEFPVLIIPAGVRTPVASKSDLLDDDGKTKLVSTNDVYVRTLNANNTPSSAKATWKDWKGIVDVSFDNREADIGRFVRRHLSGMSAEHLKDIFQLANKGVEPSLTINDKLKKLIDDGKNRFDELILDKSISLPPSGFWEVGLILDGIVPPHSPDKKFLNLLSVNNPNLTGWPIWLDSRNFGDKSMHPYVFNGRWESLFVALQGMFHHIDFNQFDPAGRFYYLSALQDDITTADYRPEPLTAFDYSLPIFRSAEAIVIGLAFAKALGCSSENCVLQFVFRWRGLQDRVTSTWANPKFRVFGHGPAHQDTVTVYQTVPIDTPNSAIAGLLAPTIAPLYQIFDGMNLNPSSVEVLVDDLLQRRW